MKKHLLAAALSLCAAYASAQYVGPDKTKVLTVKELQQRGKDDQKGTLQGTLVSHDGGKHYTFKDASGEMDVTIKPKVFPAGKPVAANTRVSIYGEYDKDLLEKAKFEVKELRVVP